MYKIISDDSEIALKLVDCLIVKPGDFEYISLVIVDVTSQFFIRCADYIQAIRGCIACGSCTKNGKCVFDDEVNRLAPVFEESDGLVVASPVYYASANATLIACLDRLFYSTGFDKTMKVGASVAVARRGGCSATYDELNKYFGISGMPIASSQYWNSVHGREKGEAVQDGEGLQTVRALARNMVFLMKSIALGKEKYGLPEQEPRVSTHFIR
ncbi:MAG: flavodoxin family protein [Clostridiales bacterium]|nr:flavodoxin family protein [Clostridiales bacterium]